MEKIVGTRSRTHSLYGVLSRYSASVAVVPLTVEENGSYNAPSGSAYSPVVVDVPGPTGTVTLEENGVYDVTDYASAEVDVPMPAGTVQITENGSHDVSEYAVAEVDVPQPSGSVELTENGSHDVAGYAEAVVDVQPPLEARTVTPTKQEQTVEPTGQNYGLSRVTVHPIPSEYIVPSGERQITENGEYDVSGYATAEVAVPQPSGNVEITENGSYDIAEYATAEVSIPEPSGTLEITENGSYDVADYAGVDVDVAGLVPAGTLDVTENGQYDVTEYAGVGVNVQPPLESRTVTPTKQAQIIEPTSPNYGLDKVTVNPIPNEYIVPSGEKQISANGVHDVTGYAGANVNVQPPLESKSATPTEQTQVIEPTPPNYGLSRVTVNPIPSQYIVPSGEKQITENGQYDVTGYAAASVEVPLPSGSVEITDNGTYDVTMKEEAVINVQPPLETKTITPSEQTQVIEPTSPNYGLSRVTVGPIPSEYVVPSGTKTLTTNGTHDVAGYASAEVAVPQPSGTVQITTNGTHDVSGYATAEVNVPTGGGGNADGIIAGSLVALENATATKIRREFASIAKKWNYRNLPSGYTQVEYIESHGTEYINTGVTGATPKTAQFRVLFVQRGVSQTVSGAQESSSKALIFLNTYYGTSSISYGSSSSAMVLTQNREYQFETMLRNGYQQFTVDGAGQIQTTKTGEIENAIPFYLFANNNNGTPTNLCTIRVYEYVLRNGNASAQKACDLVPCREDATGKYGMYDLISGTFKGNQGTGDFTGGRDVPNLVYGYTSADFSAVTEIGDYAFYNNDLQSLTLRANQVVKLGEHALDGTPIANGTGYVYVHADQVNAYKADSAWSVYKNRIRAVA